MQKILLLSQSDVSDTYELLRFQEEANNLGVELQISKYSEIIIDFKDEVVVTINGENIIEKFDIFMFRSSKSKFGHYFGHYAGIIKYIANKRNKKILNYETTSKHDNWATKLYNYAVMAENNIPVIPSYNFATFEQLEQNKDKLIFPLIAKKARGSHGDGVKILNSFENIYDYMIETPLSSVLFQEYIESKDAEHKEDIRVITIGKEVVGGYKKIAPKGSIITNLAAGGSTEKLEMTPELIEIASKIIEAFDAEYTGIDIIYKDNKPMVLEVNRAAQFEGFEKITGLNVAKKILELIIK